MSPPDDDGMTATPWLVETTEKTQRRKLAGQVVELEYMRQQMTRDQTASNAKMSPTTLDRIRRGDDTISVAKLRSVEGVLDLPDDLLVHIIENNVAAIEELETTEIRPSLRRWIMAGLADIHDGQRHLKVVGS